MAKGDIIPADTTDEEPDAADRDDAIIPASGGRGGKPPAKAAASGSGQGPRPATSRTTAAAGFFTIYKKGQGKWTRLGTAFAAAFLGILTAYNLFQYAVPFLPIDPAQAQADRKYVLLGCVLFLVAFALVYFWMSNKPSNADFLISTDSEMKKVNWTTQGELFGSTRVVVFFLFFIAMFLFVVDLVFQQFFHLIRVLQ